MRAYSLDLRQRVLADCDAGGKTKAVAQKYSVSPSWVRKLKQQRRQTGQIAPCRQRHGPRPGWEDHAERIREAVRQAPDLTLQEYRDRFALPLSRSALARALVVLGLARTKSRSGQRARPPGREAEAGAVAGRATRPRSGPTGVRGRDLGEHQHAPYPRPLPRGERLVMDVPHGHWQTTTFVAALRGEG